MAGKRNEGGGAVGRKALADLTNSRKPSSNKAGAVRRKALSDISNSVKPNAEEGTKKQIINLNALAEEPLECMHNHEACLKANRQSEMINFMSLGLELEDDVPTTLALAPVSIKKSEGHLSFWEDESPIHSSPESPQCKSRMAEELLWSPISPRIWSWK